MKKNVFQKSMLCLFTALLCIPMTMQAKVEHLLPKVHSLKETKGTPFALQRAVTITDETNSAALKKVFTDYGCTIGKDVATVTVEMVESIEGAYDYTLEGYDNEGYQLIVETNAITIKAVKPIGVIRAAQTLAQLAEGYDEGQAAIETVEITDWAAFKLRGYMHDVGRSFISVEELKTHIDLLSRFKVNTFHWHFTENQAWRFEVIDNDPNNAPDYTKLTSTESMTRFEGNYYTQAECREVAAYAHERGVTIIPEIDMPGHSEAFKRAMGFSMQTDEGIEILKEVLTQVADVFPNAPYIHIGADEEAITYENFLGIMADHIHGLGRKMVVWNPIRNVGINSNMCDMTQMWSSSGANINGVPDIDCRYNYTNHFDVFADVVGIYKSNIYYADKGSSEIAGTISAYWNDRKTPTEKDIVKQNNMYANVLASAERAWIGSKVNGDAGYIEKLGTTLPNSGEVYEEFKSWEERFLFHKAHSLKDEPIPYVKQTNVRWRITDPFPNGGNSGATFAPDQYATSTNDEGLIPETFTHEGKTYYTGMATGAGIYLRHTWGNNIIPTYYGSTNHNNMTAYAWTYVYSKTEQTVGAQIEFQNYGRSEHDKTPYADKWDRKGSDIWINGTRINPPTWVNPDTDPSNEDDLQNENFTARNPIKVTLNAGWNKVFIKLPYVGADGIRLNKWMFTCVFTDLEGKNAVEGLIYSPNQCMDEATEAVAAEISNIKRDRSNYIGTAVGLWPESAAATLDAKVKEVEATYTSTMTEAERKAQAAALQTAWADFVASLANVEINQPVSGNYYRMYTPLRASRYATGNGADAAITGPTEAATKASIWQFVKRSDNAFDIINLADGTYISPASNNNTALKTVTAQPNAGWTIKKANNTGNVIVVSGSAQFNQQKDGNLHLLNWGSGTNTTDDGCQYRLVDVTSIAAATPIKLLASHEEFVNGNIYTFETARGWMGAKDGSNNVISTAKTSHGLTGSADNAMFQWTVYKSEKGKYYLYNLGKKQFMGVQSTNNASVPFVQQPTDNALTFKDNGQNNGYPIMFSTDNAGVVNHSTSYGDGLITWTGGWNTLNDGGSNHKVALISALPEATLQDIAAIVADYEFEDQTISSYTDFENGGVYTFETARGKMGATEENAKIISTARTTVTNTKTSFFMWTVYKSGNGNYYLYNLGKKQFMGVQSDNNTEIDFVATPAGKKLSFKQSSSADYPIMFSTDNAAVVNHSTNHGGGLISWTGGWNTLDDGGSNHKVTLVSRLPEATLQEIANKVEAYDKRLYVTAEVEGLEENNPNTHFGRVRATSSAGAITTKLNVGMGVVALDYDGLNETTIDFTREYRGFEFQGFKLGEQELGKSFTLTEEQETNITAENPLVAKFTTTEAVTLFYDDDAASYRIPAIATTSTGRLIAVSDYRHCLDDIGLNRFGKGYRIDLVIRTSDDNGKTWSNIQTIAEGIDNSQANDCAYGDAAIAVVGEEVIVMAVAGSTSYNSGTAEKTSRLVRVYSANNGKDWEKTDITEKVYGYEGSLYPNVYTAFFGSGRLAVDPNFNESGKARIYGSMLTQGMGNIVIYSDDKGLTWNKLGGQVANANEPKIEILPNGQILFSARRNGGRNFNVFTYTDKANNEGTWSNAVNGCDNEGQNGTNGETFLIDAKNARGENVKLLLQSQPVGGGVWDRANVSIWYKEISSAADHNHTPDEIASGWTKGLQVSHQLSAYSAMSLQKDGRIAFFFEEAPCYQDEYKYGYCMVYMPLTIEQITKGNYFSLNADFTTESTINVVLTDAQGNEYRDQVQSTVTGVATALTTKYPFITLGDTPSLVSDGTTYTYTNTVALPFKVSSAETTIWHNIYWPANGSGATEGYPVYMSAEGNNDVVKIATEGKEYGNSELNTLANACKISWAFYQEGKSFTFKLKNKQNEKFVITTSAATGSDGGENVKYTDQIEEATAFSITDGRSNNFRGDYGLTNNSGYLMMWSVGHGRVTYSTNTNHQGAWLKFVEAPDFEALIAEVNATLDMIGSKLGQYTATEANATAAAEAKTAMENSNSVKLNTLNSYKELLDGATLNIPKEGQYFRVAYDYGSNVGKLYMQSTASSVKGLEFTEGTGNASIWYFHDGSLYAYTIGTSKNLREHGDDRGLHTTKTNAEFIASTRAKGKYNLKCGSFVHANSSNGNYFTDHCSSNSCVQHDLILEEVDMRPSTIVSTIGESEMGTFYADQAVNIPDGVKAYVATNNPVMDTEDAEGNKTGYISMTLIKDGIIPAETGALICGEKGDYEFTPSAEAGTAVEGNLLKGYAGSFEYDEVALPGDGSVNYVLTVVDGKVGFYKKASGFKVYNNKAYLNVPSAQNARSLAIRFEGSTEIETSTLNPQPSTEVYDLMGRRVLNPTKGMYIVNGRKVVIK